MCLNCHSCMSSSLGEVSCAPGLCVLPCFPKALAVPLGSNGSVKFYKETLQPPRETFTKPPPLSAAIPHLALTNTRSRGELVLALPEVGGSPLPSVNQAGAPPPPPLGAASPSTLRLPCPGRSSAVRRHLSATGLHSPPPGTRNNFV
jgi:hypothetical protein